MANLLDKIKKYFKRTRYRAQSSQLDFKTTFDRARYPYDTLISNIYSRGNIRQVWEDKGSAASFVELIQEWELMDTFDLISAALDIYASEATFEDVITGRVVWVESPDSNVEEILNSLFDRLEIDTYAFDIARALAKYGNDFNKVVIGKTPDGYEVRWLDYIYPSLMRVVRYNNVIYYLYINDFQLAQTVTQSQAEDIIATMVNKGDKDGRIMGNYIRFDNWMIIHFYLPSKIRSDIYGVPIIERARLPWKRLLYLENAMWFRKLRESVSRYVYYVQVGEYDVESVRERLRSFVNLIKTSATFSSALEKIQYRYNVWSEDEDFYIPLREGKEGTRIELLEGKSYDASNEIDYFVNKLCAALRIPRSYLMFTEEGSKTGLGMQDLRFAKAVSQIQMAIKRGLKKLCDLELILKGYDPSEVDYNIKMAQPSAIFELGYLEALRAKIEIASQLEGYFSKEWIIKNILHLPDEGLSVDISGEEIQAPGLDITSENPDFGIEVQPEGETPKKNKRGGRKKRKNV